MRSQGLEREDVVVATHIEIDLRRASSAMSPATDPGSASIVVTKRKKPHRLAAQAVSIPDTASAKPRVESARAS
jgi:hypothetical protein